MTKEVLTVRANECNFYCEKRGWGPPLVFVPDGVNDCEHFSKVSDMLAGEFTVYSFDMRGGSRSMPEVAEKVTAQSLASDVAEIIKALGIGPASIYGCSSGGQAVLSLGVLFPEVARNIMVHEAALMMDTQLPGTGFSFFENIATYGPHCDGFLPKDIPYCGNLDKWNAFGEEWLARIDQNMGYWAQYYLGSNDVTSYTKEEIEGIKNLDFSVGTWSPSWLTHANIATAERGGKPYIWFNAAHYPQVTCPDEFVEYIRKTCKKYS